jgi:hypothetical protein
VIKPTIGELLSGVAVSLRERVLPEIPPGTTRRQIQAAIGIIRRAALIWDKTGPYFYADNQDIEQTMRELLPVLEQAAEAEGNPRLEAVSVRIRATLDRSAESVEPYPSPAVLGARNIDLQELIAELQEVLFETPPAQSPIRREIDSRLRALLRRMLARELEINSPKMPRQERDNGFMGAANYSERHWRRYYAR